MVNGKETPAPGKAAQRMRSAILEADARARDDLLQCPRDQHLAPLCARGDSCPNQDRNATDLKLALLELAHVQAGARFEAERANALGNRARAGDPAARSIEGGEEAVAGGIEFLALVAGKLEAHERFVALLEVAPCAVTKFPSTRHRTD